MKPDSLGARLKLLMELRGLGSNELNVLANLPSGEVSRITTGARKRPSTENVQKLADACGTTLEWLAFGRGPAPTRLPSDTPERTVETPRRYDAAEAAAVFAESEGIDKAAIDAVLSEGLKNDDPNNPNRWLLAMREREKQDLRERLNLGLDRKQADKRAATGEAKVAEAKVKRRPKMPWSKTSGQS